MLTPQFVLSQNDDFLIASIRAPFAKVSETEISFEDTEFLFSSKPYFLRLHLPKPVIENGNESAAYDAEKGTFTVKVPKKNQSDYFPGLDMITKLLTPPGNDRAEQLVQEVQDLSLADGQENSDDDSDDRADEQRADVDCTVTNQDPISWADTDFPGTSGANGYGFAGRRHLVFSKLKEEIWEICELKDPDSLNILERQQLAEELERDQFDEDHYMCDFFENDQIACLLQSSATDQLFLNTDYSVEEQDRLHDLPRRLYPNLTDSERQAVVHGLVDVLLAYAHTFLTFDGEENVEWGWMIAKLSRTLSSLVSYSSISEVARAFYRRSICFPLYRSFDLASRSVQLVEKLLTSDRRCVLRSLLSVHRILASSGDYRYILNDLYITDYCVWIQSVDKAELEQLAACLKTVGVSKSSLGLDLMELEAAGALAMADQDSDDQQSDDDTSDADNKDIHSEESLLAMVRRNFEQCSDDDDDDDDENDDRNYRLNIVKSNLIEPNQDHCRNRDDRTSAGDKKLIDEIE